MSKKHEKVLASIFADHISGNLHWREIESMLSHYGGEFRESHGARVIVVFGEQELTLHRPHHNAAMGKNEIHNLRQFLQSVGVTP